MYDRSICFYSPQPGTLHLPQPSGPQDSTRPSWGRLGDHSRVDPARGLLRRGAREAHSCASHVAILASLTPLPPRSLLVEIPPARPSSSSPGAFSGQQSLVS